jgi:hypothetical protein
VLAVLRLAPRLRAARPLVGSLLSPS